MKKKRHKRVDYFPCFLQKRLWKPWDIVHTLVSHLDNFYVTVIVLFSHSGAFTAPVLIYYHYFERNNQNITKRFSFCVLQNNFFFIQQFI